MMIHCIGWMASMPAEHFLYFNSSRIWGRGLVPVGAFGPPVAWAAVHSGAVVLLLLTFCLLLLPLWESVIVLCFVSVLVLRSSWWGARCLPWFIFLVSRGGWAALPRGAAGLSAVCDCGVS